MLDSHEHSGQRALTECGLDDASMIAAKVGRGALCAVSDDRVLVVHGERDGSACPYAALRVPEDWTTTTRNWRVALNESLGDWNAGLGRSSPRRTTWKERSVASRKRCSRERRKQRAIRRDASTEAALPGKVYIMRIIGR